jgi:hypothetical protein
MIGQVGEQMYDAEQAAILLEVPARVIRQWKYSGRVMPAGLVRGEGRGGINALYTLAELMPHAERYHARRRRQHASH